MSFKDFKGTPEAANRYRQAKWNAARVVAEAKTQVCGEFLQATEKDFWTGLKRFWQSITCSKKM